MSDTSPNMNAEPSCNAESDIRIVLDSTDTDMPPENASSQVSAESIAVISPANNNILEHANLDVDDLPDYEDEEHEEVPPHTEAAAIETDDEDLHVPYEVPLRPAHLMSAVNGKMIQRPSAASLNSRSPSPQTPAIPLHATIPVATSPRSASPPQPQPSFSLTVEGNRFSMTLSDAEVNGMDLDDLPAEFFVDGLYTLESMLASKEAFNWINKGLTKLRPTIKQATQKAHWKTLENYLYSTQSCIVTSYIPPTEDVLVIFSSKNKKFGIWFTGQPARHFGIEGVLSAALVTIPACSKVSLQKK